jgi:hypothetical protein
MPQIYVALLDEGTSVWRPVTATELTVGVFRISASEHQPADERWQFGPGESVRCEERRLPSGEVALVAVDSARSS